MIRRTNWARRLLAPAIRRSHKLAKDEDGAVAVEFGILAIPFFAIILAIFETALTFFAQQVLESALQDSTRYILTGQSQAQSLNWDQTKFRQAICSRTFGLFACNGTEASTDQLWVKVAPITKFSDAAAQIAKPIGNECTPLATDMSKCDWSAAEAYDDGKGSDVIIAQAYYKWPTIIDVPWFNLANQAGGKRLLSAVRVFKNEPF